MPETLFLHGWGLHRGIWADTLAALPGRAPALPGYAGDAAPVAATAETQADCLAGALADAPHGPVNLVGWSMGGLIALALAARHPQQVARLVLVSSTPAFVRRPDWPHGLPAPVLAEFAAGLARDPNATLLRFLALQAHGEPQPRVVLAQLRRILLAQGEPTAATLEAGLTLLRHTDLRALVASVTCPSLVLHGARDALCPLPAGAWLARHLPHGRLLCHPTAAHAPFLSQPHWFRSALAAFFAS